MITIETIVTSRKQYVIDHVMPSDLDKDIKEGLKKKEEMINNIDGDYIRKIYPNIDEMLDEINETGISEENYLKFLNGESLPIIKEEPEVAQASIEYCINDGGLTSYTQNTIIELNDMVRTINVPLESVQVTTQETETVNISQLDIQTFKSNNSDVVTLTYDANGGKLVDSQQEKSTVEVDKNSGKYYYPAATKEGCVFKGWIVYQGGSKVAISEGQSIIYKYDHTVYAVWGAEITYTTNGGTFEDGSTTRTQIVEDVDEGTYEVPQDTIVYPDVVDPISKTTIPGAIFKDWAVTVGENTVTVETGNRLLIKNNHTVVARHNDLCETCGSYKPCACGKEEEEIDTTCPECLRDPCVCNESNYRRMYFLITLKGTNLDTYWSRNVYWSILPQEVEKPDVVKFVKLKHLHNVLDKNDLLTKDNVKTINFINFNSTYSNIDELLLFLTNFDYSVTREQLAKWVSYDYIPASRDEVKTYDKLELKSGCFAKVANEGKNYVYYGGSWYRLPNGLSGLDENDNGKMLGAPFILMSGAQVPLVTNDETGEMVDGGGLYCLTCMLSSTKSDNNDINCFIYIKVNPKAPQAKNKKNCDKPPSCVKDDEKDDEDENGESEICEDNGVENTSIDGEAAVNIDSLQTTLTDMFQKNLEPIWQAVGQLKLGLGATLKTMLTANIGITIEGFFEALANITAIINLLAEIQASLVAKLTASVAAKIKIDIGFKLLAKITGKVKASLELILKQIQCFLDSLLPQLHIEFETEINLSLDNVLNQGQIFQSRLDAELDTGIIGKRYSYHAIAAMAANGRVSADSIAESANNGSYAHDVITGLKNVGVIAEAGAGAGVYVAGPGMKKNNDILADAFARVNSDGKAEADAEVSMNILRSMKINKSLFYKPKMLSSGEGGATTLPLGADYYAMSIAYADKSNKEALKNSSSILRDFASKVKASSFVHNNDIDSLAEWKSECEAQLEAASKLAAQAGVQLSGSLELNFGFSAEQSITGMITDFSTMDMQFATQGSQTAWATVNASLEARVSTGFTEYGIAHQTSYNAQVGIDSAVSIANNSITSTTTTLSTNLNNELFSSIIQPEQQEEYKSQCGSCIKKTLDAGLAATTETTNTLKSDSMDQIKTMTDLYVSCYIYFDLNEKSKKVDQKYIDICEQIINQIRQGKLEKEYAQSEMDKANSRLIYVKNIGQTTLDSDCAVIQNEIREKLKNVPSSQKELDVWEDYIKQVLRKADKDAKFSSDNVVDTYTEETDQILKDLKSILK